MRIKVNSLNQDQIKASIDKYCMQLLPEFENVANNSDEVKFYDDDDSQDELEFSINDKVSNTHNKKRRYKHKFYVNYE